MGTRLSLVTTSEAARRLKVHPKTVDRLLRLGKLAGFKLANRWLIEQPVLEMFGKHYIGKKGRPKGYSPGRRHK